MTILMPASDQAVLGRRDAIVAALRAIVPGEGVIDSAAEMLPYESDGLMAYRQPPMVVVLPDTTQQVSALLRYCFDNGIKVVPRGSNSAAAPTPVGWYPAIPPPWVAGGRPSAHRIRKAAFRRRCRSRPPRARWRATPRQWRRGAREPPGPRPASEWSCQAPLLRPIACPGEVESGSRRTVVRRSRT